jgi:tripartite-type tricarboxylate transporter receptor subunit TctC
LEDTPATPARPGFSYSRNYGRGLPSPPSGGSGFWRPRGTPAPIITRLNTELDRIVREPETEKRFGAIGGEAAGGRPSPFITLIHQEIPRWWQVAKEAGIHIE